MADGGNTFPINPPVKTTPIASVEGLQAALDAKSPLPVGNGRIVGTSGAGALVNLAYGTQGNVAGGIVQRTASGAILLPAVQATAADSAASRGYVDSLPINMPGAQFANLGTSSGLANYGSMIAMFSMPTAATTYASRVVEIPDAWLTYSVIVHGANLGAGSGNITLRAVIANYGAGDTVGGGAISGNIITVASGATLIDQDIDLGPMANVPSKRTVLRIERRGVDGTDTLTNSWGIESVNLVRLT